MGLPVSLENEIDVVQDTDDFLVARTPDNFKCQAPQILYRDGDAKVFGANGGTLKFDVDGSCIIDLPETTFLNIKLGGDMILSTDGDTWTLTSRFGGGFHVATSNPNIRFDIGFGSPQASLLCEGESAQVSYVPNDDSDWDGSPTVVHDALDELAARLRALGG